MSKSVNLVKSDISSLFEELETVATETKLEEKKNEIMLNLLYLIYQISSKD